MRKEYLVILTILCLISLSFLVMAGGRALNNAIIEEGRWSGSGGPILGTETQQQFVFGWLPVALLWLGAGVAAGLARIAKPNWRHGLTVAGFAVLPIALTLGLAAFALVTMLAPGKSPGWQVLKQSPEPATEIVAGDDVVVYVRSEAGKIYGCTIEQANCWQEAREPLNVKPSLSSVPSIPPPGSAVSKLDFAYYNADIYVESHYVLLSDHSLWWRKAMSNAFTPIIGLVAVLLGVVGVAILVFFAFVPIWLGAGTVWLTNRIGKSVKRDRLPSQDK